MSQVVTLPKILASALAFTLILLFSYPILAQEATSTTTRKDRIEERKQKVEGRMEAKKEGVETRIEERKAKMATREAVLKERLEKFRDKKKAEVTERVSSNLNRINQKMTGQMLKHLERMSSILSKLETRVNSGSPDVKDVSSAKEAIAEAKTAIEEAKALVSAQAEKDYTVTVTTEGKVRTDVKKARDILHTDLKAAREAVIKAKQAVANAIRVAKSGKLDLPGKEGTSSGQQ